MSADPAVAEVEQVVDGGPRRATSSMRADRKPSRSRPSSPTGRFERGQRGELVVVEHQAGDEHAVDPLAHRHDVEERAAAVLVAEVVEQQVEARPCAARVSTVAMTSAKNQRLTNGTTSPTVAVRPLASRAANGEAT